MATKTETDNFYNYIMAMEDLDERVGKLMQYLLSEDDENEEIGHLLAVLFNCAGRVAGYMNLTDKEIDFFSDYWVTVAKATRAYAEKKQSKNSNLHIQIVK